LAHPRKIVAAHDKISDWRAIEGLLSWVLLIGLSVFWLSFAAYLLRRNWALGPLRPTPDHLMPEGDFANLWGAGHLARAGGLDWLYSSELFHAYTEGQFGKPLQVQDWIYPPTVLLIGVPLSFLPLFPAFIVWDIGTFAIAVLLLRHARVTWPTLMFGLAAPATWRSLVLGQYGTITGALVVAGVLLAPRYPIRAGIMLGISTLKPQQGIIVPVAWLAARHWRAIAAAALTTGLLAAAVIVLFGARAWVLFFTHSASMARGILNMPPPQPNISNGVSVFWMLRTMGFGTAPANAVHAVFALGAMVLVYRAWRRPDAEPTARMCVTVCLSLMIMPYGYTSDMVAYSLAVAFIVANNRWRLRLIDVLLWLFPVYCGFFSIGSEILFTPVAIGLAAWQGWKQMVHGSDMQMSTQAAGQERGLTTKTRGTRRIHEEGQALDRGRT